ncbi:MAG: HicB family protein [Candidatus Nitrohelix vancouverensis]|uniref:HicB family protein n=1 Tax=Candidatus Nitrohelix vancouverensis TaxID=2705534 RepID=A0A7T0G2S0_9BACT|nr:MAG: HicB family protein [Candidatus Nitrohelix vancouverensis]
MATYIGLVRKDPNSDFGVDFPDFPGCVTGARTIKKVRNMAQEALELHIEAMMEEGLPIPAPSSWEKIIKDHDQPDVMMIPVII